jgi:hypothetical protein
VTGFQLNLRLPIGICHWPLLKTDR